MNMKNRKIAACLVSVIVAGAFLVLHELYVARAHPDAAYMDTLRVIYQLRQLHSGKISWLALWGLGGEHQGLINQMFVMANIKFFSLNILLANRLTGVVVFLVALILLAHFNSVVRRSYGPMPLTARASLLAASVIIAMICFSWAGWQLFTLNLGLSQWVKNLVFVAYFTAHTCYLGMSLSRRSELAAGLGLGLIGAFIVLLIAMGWSYAFVGAVVCVYIFMFARGITCGEKRLALLKALPLVPLLAAQILYAIASFGVRNGNPSRQVFATIGRIPDLVLYALGSGTVGQEALSRYSISLNVASYIGAIALVAAIVLILLKFRRRSERGSAVPLYLIAYSFLMAVSVSIARGSAVTAYVMASRYYPDLMLFYVGVVWLWYEAIIVSSGRGRMISGAFFCGFLALVAAAQGLTYKREWAAAPYRARAFRAMNQALEQGVPDQAAARLLQSPLVYARLGDQVMLEDHLALYADLPAGACEVSGVRFPNGWYAEESGGRWMGGSATLRLPACRCGFVTSAYLPENFTGRTMTISGSAMRENIDLKPGRSEAVHIPPSDTPRTLDVSVSRTSIPATLPGGGRDARVLGAYWSNARGFQCRTGEGVR